MPPYPTPHEIEDIFLLRSKHSDGKVLKQGTFDSHFTEDADFVVTGQEHALKGKHGKEEFKTEVQNKISKMIDHSKPGGTYEVIRAIGGGESAYGAVELKTTGTTKAGDPFVHEYVYLLRFNTDKKISQLKAFFDSQHVQGHVEKHEAGK